jgi:hypothetical protein
MKHIERPSKITASLKIIEAEFPADIAASLEAYIEALEANQRNLLPDDTGLSIPETSIPPIWSHQRMMEREAHIHERVLKKLDHYRQK